MKSNGFELYWKLTLRETSIFIFLPGWTVATQPTLSWVNRPTEKVSIPFRVVYFWVAPFVEFPPTNLGRQSWQCSTARGKFNYQSLGVDEKARAWYVRNLCESSTSTPMTNLNNRAANFSPMRCQASSFVVNTKSSASNKKEKTKTFHFSPRFRHHAERPLNTFPIHNISDKAKRGKKWIHSEFRALVTWHVTVAAAATTSGTTVRSQQQSACDGEESSITVRAVCD